MVKVSLNVNQSVRALKKFSDVLDYELHDSLEREMHKVQAYSRSIHRFRHRTGRLRTAIQSEVKELTGYALINKTVDYGVYVHEGHHIGRPGQWLPDRFLNNAVKDLKPEIEAGLGAAIVRAKKRAGLT